MPGSEFGVNDVKVGSIDPTESRVDEIYSKTSSYAVYRTPVRVAVQFSDDPSETEKQRGRVIPLNNLRTQITGLINGWRSSRIKTFRSRARRYDGRVAAILVMALDGDTVTPAVALTNLRDEIAAERVSWGRFEYLISAFIIALMIFWLLTLVQHVIWHFDVAKENLWLAGRAGALGAFFSIALSIRNRTVLTNLQRWDNVSDASLRIVIGVIAAGFLVLLLGSELLKDVTFAGQNWSGSNLTWPKVLGLGFIAGFSERLVPDLLARYDGGAAARGAAGNPPVPVVTGQPSGPLGPRDGAGTASAAAEPSHAATARDAARKAGDSHEAALAAAARGEPDVAAAHAAAAQAGAASATAQLAAAQAGSSERR